MRLACSSGKWIHFARYVESESSSLCSSINPASSAITFLALNPRRVVRLSPFVVRRHARSSLIVHHEWLRCTLQKTCRVPDSLPFSAARTRHVSCQTRSELFGSPQNER